MLLAFPVAHLPGRAASRSTTGGRRPTGPSWWPARSWWPSLGWALRRSWLHPLALGYGAPGRGGHPEHRGARIPAAARHRLRRLADRGGPVHGDQQRDLRLLLPGRRRCWRASRSSSGRGARAAGPMLAILGVVLLDRRRADVGSRRRRALAGLPALVLVATGLGRWKVRWRTVVIVAAGDHRADRRARAPRPDPGERRPLPPRTALRADRQRRPRGLTTVVERKLTVNLRSLTDSTWRYIFGPLAIAAGLVLWRAPRSGQGGVPRLPRPAARPARA